MTAEEIWWVAPVAGALGGFLAGMLGVGGGIIFIPVLTVWFSKHGLVDTEITKFALANSIFLVFISGIMGIIKQLRTHSFEIKKVLTIGVPGAIIALAISILITSGNWYNKEMFQMVFLGFLILSIANMLFSKKSNDELTEQSTDIKNDKFKNIGVGMLAGAVVSLSGLGGGVIMVPLFRMVLKMPMKKATLLSMSIIPLLSIFPLVNNLISDTPKNLAFIHTGYLAWGLILPMAAGVILFAGLGIKTGQKIPVIWLRLIFAALSLFVLIKTILDFQ